MTRKIRPKRELDEMINLSIENEKLLFFTVKGIEFKKVGTRICGNGSTQHDIKDLSNGNFKTIGDKELNKILNQ